MKKLYFLIFLISTLNCFCLQKVRIQLKWYHQFQFAGIYQAKEQGYYKDIGLDLEILEINRDITSVSQVLDGKAEFGVGSVDVLYSYLSGYDVQMVTTIFQENPLILASLKKNKFKDFENFNYSKLMLNAQKFDSLPIYMMLEKMGVNINSIMSIPFDYSRIVNKDMNDVDGFIVYATDIFKYTNIYKDEITFFRPKDFDIQIYGDVIFTTKGFAQKYPMMTLGFKEATLKGWKYALAHPKKTIDLIKDVYKSNMTKDELFLEYQETKKMVQKDLVPIGFSILKVWRLMTKSLYDLNLLPHKEKDLNNFIFSLEIRELNYHEILLYISFLLILASCLVLLYRWLRPQVRTRKELECDLINVNDRLSSIQEFASIGTWSYLLQEDHFYFSKGLDHLLKKATLLAQAKLVDFLHYIHEEDKESFQKHFDKLCKGSKGFDLTFRVQRQDGEVRNFIINAYPILQKESKILQVQGEVKDITEYLEQEQKLRLTRFSIDDSNELMLWLDMQGKIFDMNNSVCSTFHVEKSDIIGHYLSDVYQQLSLEELSGHINTIKNTGKLLTEIEFDINSQQSIPFEVMGSKVSFKKGKYIFLSLRDISEQKVYENELISAKKLAEHEEQLKSNLIATMSHEFHTPINAIVGFGSMLKESDDSERPVYINEIQKSSHRLLKLLEDTLLFSSISPKTISLEEFSIKDVVQIACTEMQESSCESEVDLEYEISDAVPELVAIDAKLFASLLKNLLENALKYSNQGVVFVALDYSEDIEQFSSPFLILVVKDQGIGIEPELIEKIFDPFYQIDSSHKRVQAGTGMGLAVCKKVIECVGGTISIDSKLLEGTEITVKFPLILS
ncbi:MAG: ABC transporter substrate-binding protein [Candidatus Cloacimonetes bacterium]|nr:ABC transporter substrate-binding protein [Candidatus Cloacimonadota bacterium]